MSVTHHRQNLLEILSCFWFTDSSHPDYGRVKFLRNDGSNKGDTG
jgi:hypothetical protein